jgi:hypothetical protein
MPINAVWVVSNGTNACDDCGKMERKRISKAMPEKSAMNKWREFFCFTRMLLNIIHNRWQTTGLRTTIKFMGTATDPTEKSPLRNEGNISINWGKELTGFVRASCFTRVLQKTCQVSPEILRRYERGLNDSALTVL